MPVQPADVTRILVDAIVDPSEPHLEALRAVLAPDVLARGPFVNGSDAGSVLDAVRSPALPVLQLATYGEPESDGAETVVRGHLPPGMQISGVRLVVRERAGRLVRLVQEIEMAPAPPPSPLEIDQDVAAAIDGAFANGTPVVVAYVDERGAPKLSYRGTVQSHGPDTIALWVRDPNGGLLRAIPTNPQIALLYHDPNSRTHYEIAGRARRSRDPAERSRTYARSPEFERNLDPGERGEAVVIDVVSIVGGPPGNPVNLRRSDTDPGEEA